jgi:hypothetical protein
MRPAKQITELINRINQLIQNKKYYLKEYGTEKTTKKISNEIFQLEQVKIIVEWHEEPKHYLTDTYEKLMQEYELLTSDKQFNQYKQNNYALIRNKTQSQAFAMFLKTVGADEIKSKTDRLELILQLPRF